jgi:hypothetical protein
VVEGERDGGGGGEGVVEEAERGVEFGVAGAHVELVAEALRGVAGAAAAGCLAFVRRRSLASVLQRGVGDRGRGGVAEAAGCLAFVRRRSLASVLQRGVGDRGRGGVAASAGKGKALDGAAEG